MRKKRFFFFATITLAYSTILMIYLLLPSDSFPTSKIFTIDKLWHLLSYFFLMILLVLCFKQLDNYPPYYKSRAFFITLLHSCMSEWFQQYSPGRSSDISDWVADATGIIVALLFINVIVGFRQRNQD